MIANDPPALGVARVTWNLSGRSLFDLAWDQASRIERLVRSEDGLAARYPTSVDVAASATDLFIRFLCADEHAWGTFTSHDAPLWEQEVVELFLEAAEGIPKSYFEIEVSPTGAVFDARISNPDAARRTMRVDAGWHAPGLRVETRRGAEREDWIAALALPWMDLGLATTPPVLRANFFRIERARDAAPEFSAWSPTFAAPADFHVPSRFGFLRFT